MDFAVFSQVSNKTRRLGNGPRDGQEWNFTGTMVDPDVVTLGDNLGFGGGWKIPGKAHLFHSPVDIYSEFSHNKW